MRIHSTLFIGLFALSFVLNGCSFGNLSPSAPSERIVHKTQSVSHQYAFSLTDDERFKEVMRRIVVEIKSNPKYNKIGLRTQKDKIWFKQLLYKLWHRDITRKQFIAEGVKRYPSKRYEFTFIADTMQRI